MEGGTLYYLSAQITTMLYCISPLEKEIPTCRHTTSTEVIRETAQVTNLYWNQPLPSKSTSASGKITQVSSTTYLKYFNLADFAAEVQGMLPMSYLFTSTTNLSQAEVCCKQTNAVNFYIGNRFPKLSNTNRWNKLSDFALSTRYFSRDSPG